MIINLKRLECQIASSKNAKTITSVTHFAWRNFKFKLHDLPHEVRVMYIHFREEKKTEKVREATKKCSFFSGPATKREEE